MSAKVADASVVAALAFGEPRATLAHDLLAGHHLYEPTLFPYELLSVARKKAIANPERADSIGQALDVALSLAVNLVESIWPEVFQLALSSGLSSYDATYLALARRLKATLVTFDARLGHAASAQGVACEGGSVR